MVPRARDHTHRQILQPKVRHMERRLRPWRAALVPQIKLKSELELSNKNLNDRRLWRKVQKRPLQRLKLLSSIATLNNEEAMLQQRLLSITSSRGERSIDLDPPSRGVAIGSRLVLPHKYLSN